MSQGRLQPSTAAAGNRHQRLLLHLAMVGLFLLDLALPRTIPLLPYSFLVVVLPASFATPGQMVPLILQAYGLAIVLGLFWGFFSLRSTTSPACWRSAA